MSPSATDLATDLATAARSHAPVQEPDVLPRGLLLRITWVAVCLTVALCLVAKLLLAWRLGRLAPGRGIGVTHSQPVSRPQAIEPTAAPHLHRDHFPASTDASDWIADPPELHGFGWIDRARGIVHIPIETAIDLELAAGGK
jgi:hypothetical protein